VSTSLPISLRFPADYYAMVKQAAALKKTSISRYIVIAAAAAAYQDTQAAAPAPVTPAVTVEPRCEVCGGTPVSCDCSDDGMFPVTSARG
jgi:hypothetical protein